jgi:hypothetical protein
MAARAHWFGDEEAEAAAGPEADAAEETPAEETPAEEPPAEETAAAAAPDEGAR